MKRILVILALGAVLFPVCARAENNVPMETGTPFSISSPSVILTDAKTGRTIFEKNADEQRPVASVTKVMTILLTLEAIDEGRSSQRIA